MLHNRNILCIANPPWDGDYSSTTVELMRVFGNYNTVLYVENPYTWKDVISSLFSRKKLPLMKLLGLRARVNQVKHGQNGRIYLLVPPIVLPVNFLPPGILYDSLSKFNGWLLQRSIAKALSSLDMATDLISIISFSPAIGEFIAGKFREKSIIYHCYDEIRAARWMSKHGPRHEMRLAPRVDAIIVTSQWLLETKQMLSKGCYLVKNAANIELFETAFTSEVLTDKVVGYIGSIDERLDFTLITYLVEKLPDFQFVFIGRVTDTSLVQDLITKQNVKFIPPQKIEKLPSFVQKFSIGIIPFVKNEFTKGIYPLKINEYLAAGLPVVSTDFGHLDEFKSVVEIASTNEDFAGMVKMINETDSPGKKNARRAFAASNSWVNRVEEFSNVISSLEAIENNKI